METKQTELVKTQGVETKDRKQAISKSYLVNAFKENINKIEILKLLEEKDIKALRELQLKVVQNYVKELTGGLM